jgi:cholesterol transport system auxiliary component
MAVPSACTFNLIGGGPVPSLYDVRAEPSFAREAPAVSWQLIVLEPVASRELDTDRILVRPTSPLVKYFADVRWVDRAPRLVQTRLVEAFQKSGRITGVARGATGLRGDYELSSELRAFDTHEDKGPNQRSVRVALDLKLVRQPGSMIVATRSFEASAPATDNSITGVANAFGTSLAKLLAEAVPWSLAAGEVDYQSRHNADTPARRPAVIGRTKRP